LLFESFHDARSLFYNDLAFAFLAAGYSVLLDDDDAEEAELL
jgi:hypothetical protein